MLHITLHEEEVASLVGRAQARVRFPELRFADPLAEVVLEKVEVDAGRFGDSRLRAAAVDAMAVDVAVRDFFRRHPAGLAVALHPGLCTRFSRVDNGTLRWIDLDPPNMAELKCKLYTTPDRHMVASCCTLASGCWMEALREADGVPVLLISQGSLLRCSPGELDRFLLRASEVLPRGTELLLDHDARRPLRPSPSGGRNACLEVPLCSEHTARYPRLRLVPVEEYDQSTAADLARCGGGSRLLRPSLAHLRVA